MKIQSTLNQRAVRICDFLEQLQDELRIVSHTNECGTRVHDYGIASSGGLRAGVHLAEICLAGLADVKLLPGEWGQSVHVYTDHPLAACLGSQYAGWQISADDFFGMGSGPMRAANGSEEIIQKLALKETAEYVVGVIETSSLPDNDVCEMIAGKCGVSPEQLILCVAPTASVAGTIQVVARSVETALHKIHELGFDVEKVVSGFGNAPLPPVASNDLVGIGRTNDAVLYGGEVTLWMKSEDDELEELTPQIPSQASRDYGVPFAEIFQRYEGDFYKIDPHLFSPAKVQIVNLNTGTTFRSGESRSDLLNRSFYG